MKPCLQANFLVNYLSREAARLRLSQNASRLNPNTKNDLSSSTTTTIYNANKIPNQEPRSLRALPQSPNRTPPADLALHYQTANPAFEIDPGALSLSRSTPVPPRNLRAMLQIPASRKPAHGIPDLPIRKFRNRCLPDRLFYCGREDMEKALV